LIKQLNMQTQNKYIYLVIVVCHIILYCTSITEQSVLRFEAPHPFEPQSAINLSPPPPVVFVTKTFTSQIDHFSFNPYLGSFRVRYLINDTYYQPGSPILFYTGNEGRIEAFANNTLIMWQMAPVINAALVFVEHRYYGNSMPFGDHSMDNSSTLAYLTAEQALADFAYFLTNLKYLEPRLVAKRSPVIAIGGSYGGMLSAWMRQKYPHLVQGALASSAPVLQFINVTSCYAFSAAVSNAFTRASPNCSANIRKSWSAIDRTAASGKSGLLKLSKIFATCSPLTSKSDVNGLKAWIVSAYVTAAMVNYPYPASFLLPLPAWPVASICRPISSVASVSDKSNNDDISLLSAVSAGLNRYYYNYTGGVACLNLTVDPSSATLDDRGWGAQSCNEMVMPDSCANGITDMLQPTGDFDLEAYTASCLSQFGIRPRPNWVMTQFAGAVDPIACSNIFYANGDLDPWAPGGVKTSPNPSCPAELMKNAAHHLDLRAADARDPPDVARIRKLQWQAVQRWCKDFHQGVANANIDHAVWNRHL
ncbi:hypothetical protein BOX15_Mlig015001g5, partial [Macrostomum lignano]